MHAEYFYPAPHLGELVWLYICWGQSPGKLGCFKKESACVVLKADVAKIGKASHLGCRAELKELEA